MRIPLFVLLFTCSISILSAQDFTVEWVRTFGSPNDDDGTYLTTDDAGNVYTLGHFAGTIDFDPGAGVETLTAVGPPGRFNTFISKLDADGNFVWVKQVATTGSTYGIQVDGNGNVYYIGQYNATVDLDPGPGVFAPVTSRHSTYIVKLDTDGNFQWGIRHSAYVYSLAVDAAGNLLLTGAFENSVDFDARQGATELYSSVPNLEDMCVFKLDTNGDFLWVKQIARTTTGDVVPLGITIDKNNDLCLVGNFRGTADFDPGPSVASLTSNSVTTLFVLKLNASGDFVWAHHVGGDVFRKVTGRGIYTDKDNNIIVAAIALNRDLVIYKYSPAGTVTWLKKISNGTSVVDGYSITGDEQGNIYIGGQFYQTTDFDPGPGVFTMSEDGGFGSDLYVLKLTGDGNFVWAQKLTSESFDRVHDLQVHKSGSIYMTGHYSGTMDFDPGPGAITRTNAGAMDLFILKTGQCLASVFDFGPSLTICPGDAVPSLPATSSNGVEGTWDPAVIDNYVSGTYTFTPTCGAPVTLDVSVTDAIIPQFSFGTALTICSGNNSVPALPVLSDNGIAGSWSPATINNETSGVYTFTAIPGQCVAESVTFAVTVNGVPTVNSSSDTAVDHGATVPVNNVSGTPANVNFTWTNSNPAIGLPASGTGNVPSFVAVNTSDAPVSATITVTPMVNGCTGTAQRYTIIVKPLNKDVFVPNVFSPNGDGNNDILFVYGNFIDQLEMRIFNQWGEQQELLNSTTRGWNGTHRGKPQPVGVYTYALRAVLSDGRIVKMKGSITLLR